MTEIFPSTRKLQDVRGVAISRATDSENQNRFDATLSQDFSSQL
jgi:hypothetical protein